MFDLARYDHGDDGDDAAAQAATPSGPEGRVRDLFAADVSWLRPPPRPQAAAPQPQRIAQPASAGTPLEAAAAALDAAVAALAAVDLDVEPDQTLLDGFAALHATRNRLDASVLAVVGHIHDRAAYRRDGAASGAMWVKARSGLTHAGAQRLVDSARRLPQLPALQRLLADGTTTLAHVQTITDAASGQRLPAVQQAQPILVDLVDLITAGGSPRDLQQALRRIRDVVDPDGSDPDDDGDDAEPNCGHQRDPRREFSLVRTIDDLWYAHGFLEPLVGEKLATLIDHLQTPDANDTPVGQRRGAKQRRHDALDAVCDHALESRDLPARHGSRPHVLVTMDLASLLGVDDGHETIRTPRLRHFGPISQALARRIAWHARMTIVATLGPWRIVSVGRQQRTMPNWMRDFLVLIHGHCRGPHCDRPISWTQAHHQTAWANGGETDFNQMFPPCQKHHTMITIGAWDTHFDPNDGTVTWINRETGKTIIVPPPPL